MNNEVFNDRFNELAVHLTGLTNDHWWHSLVLFLEQLLRAEDGREQLKELYDAKSGGDLVVPLPERFDREALQKAVLRALAINPSPEDVPFLLERLDRYTPDQDWTNPELSVVDLRAKWDELDEDERKQHKENYRRFWKGRDRGLDSSPVTDWYRASYGELVVYALAKIGDKKSLEYAARHVAYFEEPPISGRSLDIQFIENIVRAVSRHGGDQTRYFLDLLAPSHGGLALQYLSDLNEELAASIALEWQPRFPDHRSGGFVESLVESSKRDGRRFKPKVLDSFGEETIVERIEEFLESVIEYLIHRDDSKHSRKSDFHFVTRALEAYAFQSAERSVSQLLRFVLAGIPEDQPEETFVDLGKSPHKRKYRHTTAALGSVPMSQEAEEIIVGLGKKAIPHLQGKVTSENKKVAILATNLIERILSLDDEVDDQDRSPISKNRYW